MWFCTIRSQDCGGVDSRFILLQTASSPLGERFRYSGKTHLFWNILQKKVFVHIVTEIFAKPPVYLLKTQFYFHLYECCHKRKRWERKQMSISISWRVTYIGMESVLMNPSLWVIEKCNPCSQGRQTSLFFSFLCLLPTFRSNERKWTFANINIYWYPSKYLMSRISHVDFHWISVLCPIW